MSQRPPPPNRYIVVQYVTKPDADAYELLKHECLREPAAVALLQKLHTSITSTYPCYARQLSVLSETLSALKSTDDLAFLERQTCSIIVYNENLTIKRQLRLLRAEIMRISTKYSM